MGKPTDKSRVKSWQSRVDAADKVFEKWERRFRANQLEKWYLGEQWEQETDKDKYTINLIFPTIEVRKPSLVYYRPVFKVNPKPPLIDEPGSTVEDRAKIREDALNTYIGEQATKFKQLVKLCIQEAHFYFGVIEVGYSADFIDNPNAGKPVLGDDDQPIKDEDDKEIPQPEQLLESEQIYIRRVPAKYFRVSVRAGNLLRDCDWCGYFEEVLLDDVKKNPRYKNTTNLKATGRLKGESQEEDEDNPKAGTVKLWKVWDQRAKKRMVWADNGEKFLLEESYKLLPFEEPLKFYEILDEFYPLPFVYNLLSPQKELNETREMQRVHRKRFKRRYVVNSNLGPDSDQIKNLLASAEDGAYVEGKPDSIWPVPDAPLDPAIVRNIPATKDDFREISGITGEQRGVSDAETATQAQIMNVRSQIRESSGRQEVGEWLGSIGQLILETIEKYRALDFYIIRSVDLQGQNPLAEIMRIAEIMATVAQGQPLPTTETNPAPSVTQNWEKVNVADFGSLNYEVTCDVEQLSPVAQETERANWNQVLSLMSNQQVLMLLTTSDLILKKTMNLYGIRSEREIAEFKKLGQLALMMMMQQAQAQQGGGGGTNPASLGPAQSPVEKQLQGQMGFQGPLG